LLELCKRIFQLAWCEFDRGPCSTLNNLSSEGPDYDDIQLTTGAIRSSSAGFVGTLEEGTVGGGAGVERAAVVPP